MAFELIGRMCPEPDFLPHQHFQRVHTRAEGREATHEEPLLKLRLHVKRSASSHLILEILIQLLALYGTYIDLYRLYRR